MASSRCNKCLYYEDDALNDKSGRCRRYPSHAHRRDNVVLPTDWCGEFAEKPRPGRPRKKNKVSGE